MKKMIIVSVLLLVALCSFATNGWEKITVNELVNELQNVVEKIQTISKNRDLVTIEVLYQDWENEVWVNDELQSYTYDENGFVVEMIYQEWQENVWINYMRTICSNNEFGWPLEITMQMWDSNANVWVDMVIYSTNYNAEGQPLYSLIQMYFSGVWTNIEQMTYTWDGDLLMEILTEEWDFSGGTGWSNDEWEIYTYDGIDEIEQLEKMWEEDSIWVDNQRTTSTYDNNHHLLEKLLQGWDLVNWNNHRHSAYSYDAEWHEIQDFEREWDGEWVNFQDKYYTWENGYMIEKLTYQWNDSRNWVNHSKVITTYGEVNASEEVTLSQSSLNNYPNPFNPTTTISFSVSEGNQLTKLEIFNAKGQLVKTLVNTPLSAGNYLVEWNGKNDNQKNVVSGIYFYRLTSGKSQNIQKMILMK